MADGDIEVGAGADALRYWRAMEERRQAEMYLAAQLSSVQAMEARAGSLLAWSVGAIVALVASSHKAPPTTKLAAVLLGVCAVVCVVGSWPTTWHYGSYTPSVHRELKGDTELEVTELAVRGLEAACEENDQRISFFSNCLRLAWVAFALAAAAEVATFATS